PRLDRERQLACLGIDGGDLRIDLLADCEAVRTLLAALAREVGLSNEADHAVCERHLDAVVLHGRDGAGDDVALLVLAGRGGERVARELLDAEADALLIDVDVENLDLHDIALLEALDGFLSGLLPVEIREMHHAVDFAGQADEQAELRDVLDLALEL